MFKFTALFLCLWLLFCQALTLAIDSTNSLSDSNSNVTSSALAPQPEYAALYVNNKVFYVHFIRLNWLSAAEYCASQNLQLASINSPDDTQSLLRKLGQQGLLRQGINFWLGGSDLGHVGQWTWLTNGRPLSYSNWFPGQPNNYQGIQHCLEMLYDGRWNDNNCDEANNVICENRCPLTSYDVPIYTK